MGLYKRKQRSSLRLKQRGNVSTEWTISTLIMIAVLFAPLGGDGQSVMGVMMDSLQGFHKHGSAIFSLP